MGRKTKKEKIRAEDRRKRFLYSLRDLKPEKDKVQNGHGDTDGQNEKQTANTEVLKTQIRNLEDFTYLRADLLKTAILAVALIGLQILIYLTSF